MDTYSGLLLDNKDAACYSENQWKFRNYCEEKDIVFDDIVHDCAEVAEVTGVLVQGKLTAVMRRSRCCKCQGARPIIGTVVFASLCFKYV